MERPARRIKQRLNHSQVCSCSGGVKLLAWAVVVSHATITVTRMAIDRAPVALNALRPRAGPARPRRHTADTGVQTGNPANFWILGISTQHA